MDTELQFDSCKLEVRIAPEMNPSDLDRLLESTRQQIDSIACHADCFDYGLAAGSGIIAAMLDHWFQKGPKGLENFITDRVVLAGFLDNVLRYEGICGNNLKERCKNFLKNAAAGSSPAGALHSVYADPSNPAARLSISGLVFSILSFMAGKSFRIDESGLSICDLPEETLQALSGLDASPRMMLGLMFWVIHMSAKMARNAVRTSCETVEQKRKDFENAGRTFIGSLPVGLIQLIEGLAQTEFFRHSCDEILYLLEKETGKVLSFLKKKLDPVFLALDKDLNMKVPGVLGVIEQQLPAVLLNEIVVRSVYGARQIYRQLRTSALSGEMSKALPGLDWERIFPQDDRTLNRMLTTASLAFTAADLSDAAINALFEKITTGVFSPENFVSRINFIGAGRAVICLGHEWSDWRKESRLKSVYEQLLRMKADFVIDQLSRYESELNGLACEFLARDLAGFAEGMDLIEKGTAEADLDLFIQGNVLIQKRLGKKAQFTNQEEFDSLMNSDIDLIL